MRQKIQVMLIEANTGDEDSIRLSLLSQTTPAFTIIRETTLQHGIDLLKKETPDIVLLDMDLPDSPGLAALHAFREADQNLPVVVLVNQDGQEIAAAAIESGAQDYGIKTETELGFLPRILRYALERNQLKTKLQENGKALQQQEFSHLMNNLPGMAYRCIDDDTWTMLFVSQGCADLTGYPPEALLGNSTLSYQDLIHPEARESG